MTWSRLTRAWSRCCHCADPIWQAEDGGWIHYATGDRTCMKPRTVPRYDRPVGAPVEPGSLTAS